MVKIIDGKGVAKNICDELAVRVKNTLNDSNYKDRLNGELPGLAVILVGNDPASNVYVTSKGKKAKSVGFNSFEYRLEENTSEEDLLSKVEELNNDNNVHGILIQLPLPKHIDEKKVINAISPSKDVDGFTIENVGKLSINDEASFVPCTPLGCKILLESVFPEGLDGKHAIVIGRSNIVGKPMANLLLQKNCTITIAHSKTKDIPALCKDADIVVAAVGKPNFVKGDWLKEGSTVIDVGINSVNVAGKSKLIGDVDFEGAKNVVYAITPVPGGVGPMTIACLLKNTWSSFTRKHNIPE